MSEREVGNGDAGLCVEPDSVVARVLRMRRARVALSLLALLALATIFAPFLANDRPYALAATHPGRFEDARRDSTAMLAGAEELSNRGATPWFEEQSGSNRAAFVAELDARLVAAARLAYEIQGLLQGADLGYQASAEDLARAREELRRGNLAGVAPWIRAARAQADEHADEARMLSPAGLATRSSSALVEALSPTSVFLCVFVIGLLAVLLPMRLLAARAMRRSWFPLGPMVLAVLVASLAALAAAPKDSATAGTDHSTIKADIASGRIVVASSTWAPVPMGFAETHLDEALRPPTWLASAAMTPAGRYVHAPAEPPDPSGFEPAPTPVVPRPFEPALNSPWRHVLGTDSVGRDVLARTLWGGRVSLVVGCLSALVLTVLGTILGGLAGYCGGRLDLVLSRAIEILVCFPAFLLVLCALYFVDPSVISPLFAVALVIGFVGWTGVARLVRAECARLAALEFVLALRASGFSEARILFLHVLPNALGPAAVACAFAVGNGILAESALSFLGLGVQTPIPSWGAIVGETSRAEHWWLWLFPGLCILATVACFHTLADALRDALDPRMESS